MKPVVKVDRDPNEKPRVGLHELKAQECFRFLNWQDPAYFYMKTDKGTYVALNSGESFPVPNGFREVERVKVFIRAVFPKAERQERPTKKVVKPKRKRS